MMNILDEKTISIYNNALFTIQEVMKVINSNIFRKKFFFKKFETHKIEINSILMV